MLRRVLTAGLHPGIPSGTDTTPCSVLWLIAVVAERASAMAPLPGTGGTVAHRLMRPLPVEELGSLLPGGPVRRLAVPCVIGGVDATTSAGVQLRLVPSFSVEESSSESSNIRSLRRSGFRGEDGDMEFNFLGPGRLRGLDSSPDEPPLDSRERRGL